MPLISTKGNINFLLIAKPAWSHVHFIQYSWKLGNSVALCMKARTEMHR
jgi:hypothetical protein